MVVVSRKVPRAPYSKLVVSRRAAGGAGVFLFVSSYHPSKARNFALRKEMYGEAIHPQLAEMIEVAKRRCGIVAKFTGSGGALVCVAGAGSRHPRKTLSTEEFVAVKKVFQELNFTFEPIIPDGVDVPEHDCITDSRSLA